MQFYNKYRNGIYTESNYCMPVIAKYGTGGGNTPLVIQSRCLWDGTQIAPTLSARNCGGGQRMPDKKHFNAVIDEIAGTLDSSYYKGAGERNGQERTVVVDKAVAVDLRNGKEDSRINGTLQAKPNGGISLNTNNTIRVSVGLSLNTVVRRLTPEECEALQGFEPGWTSIGEWVDSNGKRHKEADSPRYKAIGNSIALPFWQWLADRIVAQYDRPITMGSLFDGIGGFPLVFQRAGCTPVWASEIEEFCIAVTKKHFPEETE